MAIKVIYADIDSAKRGMRKRGVQYSERNCFQYATPQPGSRHFDLHLAHVVRYINKPQVTVEYVYFNRRNQPASKHAI